MFCRKIRKFKNGTLRNSVLDDKKDNFPGIECHCRIYKDK